MTTIRIPSPCPVPWDTMTAAEGGRYCAVCTKVVVDLTDCTLEEALAHAAAARDGEPCARFRLRDGRAVFRAAIAATAVACAHPGAGSGGAPTDEALLTNDTAVEARLAPAREHPRRRGRHDPVPVPDDDVYVSGGIYVLEPEPIPVGIPDADTDAPSVPPVVETGDEVPAADTDG